MSRIDWRAIPRAPLRAILAAALSLFAAAAWASAYLYPPGEGQIIVTATFTQAWRGFDANGKFVPTRRFRQIAASAYAEIGLFDRLDLVLKPEITRSNYISAGDKLAVNSTGSEIGARYRLATWRSLRLAMETSAIPPSPRIGRNTALSSDAYGGGQFRLLAGLPWTLGAWSGFFDAGLGYRMHVGAPPAEWRGEATIGVRPRPDLLALLQYFTTMSDGRGAAPFGRFRQDKLQASLVYDLDARWSLQLGALTTLAGLGAPAEQGAVAAVWRRF